jgi:hypothetical protein
VPSVPARLDITIVAINPRRRFYRPSGLLPLLGVLLAGVLRLRGRGLHPTVKTVAVLPFENMTTEPTLTQEINASVREAVESRLGLRASGENTADALVRGSITRYEPDLPVAYTGTQDNRVAVTRRLVQITVNVEIIDQREGKPLWQRDGLTVGGLQTGSWMSAKPSTHHTSWMGPIPMVMAGGTIGAGRARWDIDPAMFSASSLQRQHGEAIGAFQLQEEMPQARLAPSLNDGVIRRRILVKIDQLGLPTEAGRFKIQRLPRPRQIVIEGEYREDVHLPLFNHTFVLKPRAVAPL